MTGAYETGARGPTAVGGRLVAALLVVALLLCHGALGALHQASSWPVEHAGGHPAGASPSSADHHGEHYGGLVAHANYAAVLFVFLLGAVLALFAGRFPTQGVAFAPRLFGRVSLPLSLRHPRGPTLPLLQVFRL